MEISLTRSLSPVPTGKGLNGGFEMRFRELFEKCSKMMKNRPKNRVASSARLGSGRTLNILQKTIYSPLYITLPSIGFSRRGNV
jgi:hypothetical protein